MGSSSGSLETSANSHPLFSFSSFMSTSYSDLLTSADEDTVTTTTGDKGAVGRGLSDRIAERTGSGVPKFKSIPPPSLPISPPPISPSSYFSIPAGLSPAELLDSPVLLSTSNILPSPTTGTFPSQGFNWRSNSNSNQQDVKREDKNYLDFSFQPQARPSTTSASMFQPSTTTITTEQALRGQQPAWSFQEPTKQDSFSSEKTTVKSEFGSYQSFSPEIATIQTNTQSNGNGNNGFQSDYGSYHASSQSIREQRRSEDGYNWRKYGQKQVKGSENPRSYYKCTYPNCPTKKKVERSLEGQVTEIVYKGTHNHPKPQSTRRSSLSSSQTIQASNPPNNEVPDQPFVAHGTGQMDSVATPENSSISMGDDDFEQSSQKSKSGGDDFDEDEPEAKRWKKESENEGISAPGSRTVREPRVVVQTTSDIDILDDGYRWRKYGQKVVKGNPNPSARQRQPLRQQAIAIADTTAAATTTNNNMPMATRPSTMTHLPNNSTTNPLRHVRHPTSEAQAAPFTLEMLQSPDGFGFSSFGNSMATYMNQPQHQDNVFSRTKEEPRDDMLFESLLC
ncbi:WRKY transcription factor WRKY24 [Vitis vinifera]|uniref:WRKY transcription factor WRKY24 n=1 Tax=Vitis vinifera TaxID=29760 RepID=A0A438KNK4_VITVI|nr:WRKY transcription factor WRKY24 [Vitis vinifera]